MKRLDAVQIVVLESVQADPGRFSRSQLAKLLVGSRSGRMAELSEHLDYGRLAGHGRKEVTCEIDILIQHGYLSLDHRENLFWAPGFPTLSAIEAA